MNFILAAEVLLAAGAVWWILNQTEKKPTEVHQEGGFADYVPWVMALLILVVTCVAVGGSQVAINWLRLAVHNRFSLLGAALPFALVAVGLHFNRELLENLFVMLSPKQLGLVAFGSVLLGGMVLMTSEVVEKNAPTRFQTDPEASGLSWSFSALYVLFGVIALALIAIPLPAACWWRTRAVESAAHVQFSKEWNCALCVGLLSGAIIVGGVYAVYHFFLNGNRPIRGIQWYLQSIRKLGPGYVLPALTPNPAFRDGGLVFAPGQGLVFTGGIVALAVYVLSGVVGQAANGDATEWLTPLFYLLVLMILANFTLSGVAFLLDYVRFPVTLATLILIWLCAGVPNLDHEFRIVPEKDKVDEDQKEPVQLSDLAKKWNIPKTQGAKGPAGRTLVAVTAAGGGIQASAWTAQVLTGLRDRYEDEFISSLRLVSAVSGGSVGTMFYLDNPKGKDVVDMAAGSGLTATGRGLAYPDLLRLFFSPAVDRTWDRGSELEDVWVRRLAHTKQAAAAGNPSSWRLKELLTEVQNGDIPFPMFNSTIAETGQRMVIAPAMVSKFSTDDAGQRSTDRTRGREFLELYHGLGGCLLPISTAARLSATFPYVSPLTRPAQPQFNVQDSAALKAKELAFDAVAYHYADGGYIDNEGMVALITALQEVLAEDANKRKKDGLGLFDHVLLLRIQPFPEARSDERARAAQLDLGWYFASAGPIEALQNVRVASQTERNEISTDVFKELEEFKHVDVIVVPLTFQPKNPAYRTPLSWMLSADQKNEIYTAWDELVSKHRLDCVDNLFKKKQ
jgi:hypothetical protein